MLVFGVQIDNAILVVICIAVGAIIFMIGYTVYNRFRFTALLCERYLETYKIKKRMKPKMTDVNFQWKNFTYTIDFKSCIIDNKNKPIIYYEYIKAQPIAPLTGMKIKEDSQVFKIVTDGKIMQHLGDRKLTRQYMYIIIGLVVVVGLVSLGAIYMMNQNNKELAGLMKELMNVTRTINPPVVIP